MASHRSGFLAGGGAAALLFGLFIAGGLIFIFAGALARANQLEAEAAIASAEVAALQERVDAGTAELGFMDTPRYTEQAARAVGYGEEGERPFRLPADAPDPPTLPRLGNDTADEGPPAPLDAWLTLLFGS